MNEEEKKVIEEFIKKCNKYNESVEIKGVSVGEENRILDIVCKALNSIEKLQKENEELKLKYKLLYNGKIEMIKARELKIPNSVVSKQKIKDKIEHYQKLQDSYIEKYDKISKGLQAMINALQELLEGRE